MDAKHIKFTDSASLRCTRFEPYVFRFNTTRTHQNFGRCITASCALKNVCAKNCRKQLCSWFVKCKTDHVTSHNQHGGPWEMWIFFFFRKCWDSLQLMWPFGNSWWPRWRKEINFPHQLWPPKFWRIIISACLNFKEAWHVIGEPQHLIVHCARSHSQTPA